MTPERWQRVEEVLQAALDRPQPERAAFLIEACFGDDELQHEATSLIEAHDNAGDFIEEPAIAQDARLLISSYEHSNIGREIGPYKIIERIGSGGMGEVYLAQDSRLDRLVALKILPAYFVSDDTRLRRFQIEARAASALNHPNILTIFEVGQFEDVHFIATEYIDGQTIRDLIQREDLSLGEVFDIAVQFVSGLAAAHAAGIIHRDIKPENIMRRGDGGVKILDFGIVKLLEEPSLASNGESTARTETEAGVMLGTMGYMSPEQVRGLQVDERTDIWSSGVVLYELLTRRRPFNGVTHADTLVAILDREPAAPFAIANSSQPILRQIQGIVRKALRKTESERYQTALEMLADLKLVSRDLDTADACDQAGISSRTRVKEIKEEVAPAVAPDRHRYYLLSAVVLLAVIFVGVVLFQRHSALNRSIGPAPPSPVVAKKPYSQMSQAEQLAFVDEQEQRISAMMGERPVKLNEEALRSIKGYVDRYAARINSAAIRPGEESLQVVYGRATPYVPVIAQAFAGRRIPIVVGIYIPMIESAYQPCFENSIGAKGLFQFLPQTAEQYGVARADMCDVQKMAPAAAHYIADRMAELGDDSQSMTLVLLSYNRGPDGVRDALRRLRETDANYERNFWTLFANRDKLDEGFRRESAGYVPAFFAAAIVGENPEAFELRTPALSTLVGASLAPKP